MIVRTAEQLTDLIREILRTAGANDTNANRVAEALVPSHLAGVDTHGLWSLPRYVDDIRAGLIAPTAQPAILQETPASALLTGNWTFGHVAAKFGVDVAIQKAERQGVAAVVPSRPPPASLRSWCRATSRPGPVSLVSRMGSRSRTTFGSRSRTWRRPSMWQSINWSAERRQSYPSMDKPGICG